MQRAYRMQCKCSKKAGFRNVGAIFHVKAAALYLLKGFLQGASQMQYKSKKVWVQQSAIYIQC